MEGSHLNSGDQSYGSGGQCCLSQIYKWSRTIYTLNVGLDLFSDCHTVTANQTESCKRKAAIDQSEFLWTPADTVFLFLYKVMQ